MSELDERLGDELERLAASYAGSSDPEAVIEQLRHAPPATAPRRRRGPVLLAAAACIASLVVAGAVVSKDTTTDVAVTLGSTAPATVVPRAPGSSVLTPMSTLPRPPATEAARVGGSVVTAVAGNRYIVWGGEDAAVYEHDRADGFWVDLTTGAVTAIPAAPFGDAYGVAGAWTGDGLIAWSTMGTPCAGCAWSPEGARWDLSTNTWRRISPPPPDLVAGSLAVATDRLVVVVGKGGEGGAYDLAADRWIDVPAVWDDAYFNQSLIWTGSEVLYWATTWKFGAEPGAVGEPVADRGWRWQPGDDGWTELPAMPIGHRTSIGSAVWTGTELVVWGMATGGAPTEAVGVGARWQPATNSWQPMAASPQARGNFWEGLAASECLGVDPRNGNVLVWPLRFQADRIDPAPFVYRSRANAWTTTSIPTDARAGSGTACLVGPAGQVLVPDPTAPARATLPR